MNLQNNSVDTIFFVVFPPYGHVRKGRRGPGDLYGIVFQNITIAAPSVLDEPDILWGMSDGLIYGLIFDNVVIGNKTIENIEHFYHNEYVIDLPKIPYED